MKVNISTTLQVEDDDLRAIAAVLDGKESRRTAKRDEVKEYVWGYGRDWRASLREDHAALFGAPEEEEEDDLIGDADPDNDEDLI